MDGFLVAFGGPPLDGPAWARWLADVMTSWPVQLAILLLWAGLGLLLVLHAQREWEHGLRNRYLQAGLLVAGAFFVLQFLFATSSFGWASWPAWPFVIESVLLFALWLYAFIRFMTRQRSGKGDDESRTRGAALDAVIHDH
jgi:4-amino-4-deoxy-L-arabinose transferase-like glycosyltransferase